MVGIYTSIGGMLGVVIGGIAALYYKLGKVTGALEGVEKRLGTLEVRMNGLADD